MGGKKKAAKRKQKAGGLNINSPPNSQPHEDVHLRTDDLKEDSSGSNPAASEEENLDQLIEKNKDYCDSVELSKSDQKFVTGGSENGEERPQNKPEEVIEVIEIVNETDVDRNGGTGCIECVESIKQSVIGGISSDGSSNEDYKAKMLVSVEKVEDSRPIHSPTKEIDDNIVLLSDVRCVDASGGSQNKKEAQTPESSQKQKQEQVRIIPPMPQSTSWKSCCGLFEVLAGDNR